MTEPDDLVEVEVPSEHLRAGDALLIDTVEHHVDDDPTVGDSEVTVRVPDPLPIPRGQLVRVRRPRSATTLGVTGPPTVDPQEFAEVRDLALALADLAATATPETVDLVAARRDRVRTRLEDSTDGTAEPDAPVLGLPQPAGEPPAEPPAVDPPVRPGAPKDRG